MEKRIEIIFQNQLRLAAYGKINGALQQFAAACIGIIHADIDRHVRIIM